MDRRLTGAFIGSAKNLMERRILMRKSRKRMGTGENRAEKQEIGKAKRLKSPPPRDDAELRDFFQWHA